MWVCSSEGFASIVRKSPGEFHLRFRLMRDAKNICKLVGFPNDRIITTSKADYRYRVILSSAELLPVFVALAGTITYSNFKAKVSERPDQRAKLAAYWVEIVDFKTRLKLLGYLSKRFVGSGNEHRAFRQFVQISTQLHLRGW